MASPSRETPDGSTPPAPPGLYTMVSNDLKHDYKSVMNQAVWNAVLLYPFYAFDVDEKIFKRGEGNVTMALKIAGLCAGMTEAQKIVRKTALQLGVNPKIVYPFGLPYSLSNPTS